MPRLFRLVPQLLLLIVLFGSAAGGALAQQADKSITNIAPDECTMLIASLGEFKTDANGNATERWLAQEEIQQSIATFQQAIKNLMDSAPPSEPEMQELLEKLPVMLMKQPFAVYFSNFKMAGPPTPENIPSFDLGAAIELGEHEAWLKQWMTKTADKMKQEADDGEEIKTVNIDGHDFYQLTFPDNVPVAELGIVEGRFLFALGDGAMQRMLKNTKSDPAPWLSELLNDVSPKRLAAIFHLNMEDIWQVTETMGAPIPEFLHLEEMQSASLLVDLQEDEMVMTGLMNCPQKLEGLLSILDVKPITRDFLKEVPSNVTSVMGGRMSVDNLWTLAKRLDSEFGLGALDQFIVSMEEDTGLNFEQDILGSLEGAMYGFSKVDLVNPTGGTVLSLKVKDPENFQPRFKKINKAVSDEINFQNNGTTYEVKESSGSEIHTIQAGLINFSWSLVEDQLLMGLDPSAIRSQLRKRKNSRSKWISEPRFAGLFSGSDSEATDDQYGDPIAVSTTDYSGILRLTIPSLGAALGNSQPIPEFDFTIDDLPPVEALVNGVIPNTTALYRTKKGFALVEKSVLPGNMTVAITGVGIGMMLPAVQATRHAARRVASSNNMRQLVLSNLNFEVSHGSFPTAYTKDKQGNKLLSWRVHILPYLEAEELYNQFHLDEPWDSPHNKKLIGKMPEIFINPALPLAPGMTTYLGVTGKNSALAPPSEGSENGKMTAGVSLPQITDGTSNTLMIVDSNLEHAVTWTKPDDFDPSEHDDFRAVLSGTWAGDLIATALCDGSVTFFGLDKDRDQLQSMMLINDGK